jgi:5-methyltetrahydrofolate--homocysteine methyltransferase
MGPESSDITLFAPLRERVVHGDAANAEVELQRLLDAGVGPTNALASALIPAMDTVGEYFSRGEFFVPEMLTAARAMKRCMALLEPLLVETDRPAIGRVVIGTVKGDVHDIGKNIVATMLYGAGFDVHDLGVDVPTARFVEVVREERPDILGLSALLTTTMPVMKDVISALDRAGARGHVRVLVGGAPLTAEYAVAIGADAYAAHAGHATVRAKELVGAIEITTGGTR